MAVKLLLQFLSAILLFSVIGCASIQEIEQPTTIVKPLVSKLASYPPPERKVTIAVYKFIDMTGQRKPGSSVALLSSAVTQGGEIWLIQALKSAGKGKWFQVLERVGLDNLIKERQIIRSTRTTYEGEKAKKIKPLLFAGVLIEGGIVGYDTNKETGGSGARFLGIGINDEYRKDVVSVGLRLVSVQTGEVLLAVSAEKTILSYRLTGNLFKFLDMGTKLLETELGFTENESVSYAVIKAIEQSICELIEQGEKQGLWEFKVEEAF
jgi:curli production assembly/transport component CsgG